MILVAVLVLLLYLSLPDRYVSMRLSKQSISPAVRLARSYAAVAPKPEPEYEAESSTAAQKRQQYNSSRPTNSPKPRRGPRAVSLLRAQKLAKALQSVPIPSKVDITQTATPPPPPTIADLEAKRPDRPPPAITAKSYSWRYQRLFDSIDQAFTSKQLLPFARKLGVKIWKGRGKEVAVRGILKTWGWEDPDQVYEPEKKTQGGREREWNLTKAELWLIMRDPACVKPAMDEGVKLTIPPTASLETEIKVDTGMRTLRGQGYADVLQELHQRILDARAVRQLDCLCI
jgi:hypothetical protein